MRNLHHPLRHGATTTLLAAAGVLALAAASLAACGDGDGEDRPGVEVIDSGSGSTSGTGSVSGTHSGSVSGSGTSPGTSSGSGAAALGAYEPVSDVANHAKMTLDMRDINDLLNGDPIDFAAIEEIYAGGRHSPGGSGMRTFQGFAATADRSEDIWDDYAAYYGDAQWLDTFVTQALRGTGPFAGEPDAVRRQGVQKGIQNQILVAWTIHELVAALEKARDGNFDPASGAPHNWDEAWAFYHGEDPDQGPSPRRTSEARTSGRVRPSMTRSLPP